MQEPIETAAADQERADRRERQWARPVAVWFLIAAIFIGSHTAFHFQKRHYEVGDEAANALQIHNAKSFQELYGNYSRWGFHHPGPAWFYAYALGEALLYDATRVVNAPFNAHLLTGIMLQVFFFTWAITIAQRHVRHRALTPLLLVFAGLHFSAVNFNILDSSFQHIWPPYVLAMPFLCFIVAGASVASGKARDLVPLVLTGALLVHSHVAQPLFVVPLALLAYFGPRFIRPRGERHSLLWAMHAAPRSFAIALAILAIFVLPLLIDLGRGEQSNLRLIVSHFTSHSGDHKTVAQSIVYFLAFLCYVPNPDHYCDRLTTASLAFLRERWVFLIVWGAVGIATVVLLRRRNKTGEHDDATFERWLAIFFAAAVGLTLVWGKLQNGSMFAFNSHFNFGLLFVLLVLLGIGATRLRVFAARSTQPALYVLAVPLLVFVTRGFDLRSSFPSLANDNSDLMLGTKRAVRADKQAPRAKFIVFEHHQWPQAAGISIALLRRGYEFRVPPDWYIMFGERNVADLPQALVAGEVALWRLRSSPTPGGSLIATSLPKIDPAGSEISFRGPEPNALTFSLFGWHIASDPDYSWNDGLKGLLYFAALPATADVAIRVHLFPAGFSGTKPQRVAIKFNDGAAEQFDVWDDGVLTMRVPAEIWNRRGHATLSFEFPDATSLSALGISDDQRLISCGFRKITFGPAPQF